MNTRQKGNKAELEAKKILEGKGYLVMRSPRTMVRIASNRYVSRDNDYFNLFDLCAKCCNATIWVQVKSTPQGVSSVKKEIEKFYLDYCHDLEIVEIWERIYGGFKIHSYLNGNWVKDEINLIGESKGE